MTDGPTPQELPPVLLTMPPCPWWWLVPLALPPSATRSQASYFPTVRSGGRGSPTHSSSPVEGHSAGWAGRSYVTTLDWHRPGSPAPEPPDLLQKPRRFWHVDLIPCGRLWVHVPAKPPSQLGQRRQPRAAQTAGRQSMGPTRVMFPPLFPPSALSLAAGKVMPCRACRGASVHLLLSLLCLF